MRRFEARAMASPLRLDVCWGGGVAADGHASAVDAARAADAAWAAVRGEFEAAEQAMSRFRDSSDLTRLNRAAGTGRPVEVPRRLERALAAADRAHRITEGRFDPRRLHDLERLGYPGTPLDGAGTDVDGPRSPRSGRIVERVGEGRLRSAMAIDLGGIGKGLALRWGAVHVERSGFSRYLLEAGGDVVVRGASPDDGPWHVGIEDPSGAAEPLAAIVADAGAIATSSVRIRSWTHAGRTVHHLLDPRTGEPADGGLRAVTVAGPDPAWAEVWSKTLFIVGAAAITGEARRRGLAAWWVTDDGRLEMTPAARMRTAWVAGED